MSIEVQNISKKYNKQIALDNLSFSIKKGSIVGLIGPNGAGKSTLMKILTGYLSADSGSVMVNGFDIEKSKKIHSRGHISKNKYPF
jgi:ABC-2 type transport system ATP-binding protein